MREQLRTRIETRRPTCPCCGHAMRNARRLGFFDVGDTVPTTCRKCGAAMSVMITVRATFHSVATLKGAA